MIVLAITGKIGSGKDTTSDYLCSKYGFKALSFADLIDEKILERGQSLKAKNHRKIQQDIAFEFRTKYGMDYWAQELVRKAQTMNSQRLIFKEPRVREDVLPAIKEFKKNFKIIEIVASTQTRFERLKLRAGPKDTDNYQDFMIQEKREESLQYYEAAKLADFRIINENNVEVLYKNLDNLMKHLLN